MERMVEIERFDESLNGTQKINKISHIAKEIKEKINT